MLPVTILAAAWSKVIARMGIHHTLFSGRIFLSFGVLPIRDHYYQPLIDPKKHLTRPLNEDRNLPGINFNVPAQLELLNKFNYSSELLELPMKKNDRLVFYYDNNSFVAGDAEYLYNIIRFFKPRKMIEIGSGFSTLLSIEAFRRNKQEDSSYVPEHICIEPYEQPWLEKTPAKIVRQKVEDINKELFLTLQANDILFIDSSHMIRPQGDVLFEFLEILPLLEPGVLVHIHDIFTPKDYLASWIVEEHKLWNEQYLLEAFLTFNDRFEILGALNHLAHHHRQQFAAKCPVFGKQSGGEPGSFWIRRI